MSRLWDSDEDRDRRRDLERVLAVQNAIRTGTMIADDPPFNIVRFPTPRRSLAHLQLIVDNDR